MSPDEKAIRQLVQDWMRASLAHNFDALGRMMADDVVFLRAGCPMLRGRENFLSLARANQNKLSVEGRAETLEVHIDGKLAHMWNRLSITITPKDGSAPFTKAGDTMSLLRKEPDGRWVLVRDVNLLPP
jgi:uncharacterized protein (TIGR02246 family)